MTTNAWADSNYYVDSNGIMVTDKWLKTTSDSGEEEWYYFGSTGKTLDDTWKKINDKWYHFDGSGRMELGVILAKIDTGAADREAKKLSAKDAFDVLYAEGAEAPKMLSIGLHCRLIGRPGRLASLKRFIDYVQGHEQVWFARRVDIARHWQQVHPFPGSPRP